jgi:hypothetical protein
MNEDYQTTKELAEVKTKVEVLISEVGKEEERLTTLSREIFQRISALERRMAQVLVIALIASILLPIVFETTFKAVDSIHITAPR